jgi:hypothetical protein
MSYCILGLYKESAIFEAYPQEAQEAFILIHIFAFLATIYFLLALIIWNSLELCDFDVDVMDVEPESDASSDFVHVARSSVALISLVDTASGASNKQGSKYNIEEDEIVDNDCCEFSREELDRPYYALSPRARGWQRIRSNLLKERAVERAAQVARYPPLPRRVVTPLNPVQCRRPALSPGKKSPLRESFKSEDFEVDNKATED